MLALFAFILTAGASQSALPAALAAGPAGLAALRPCDWGALQPAVPIMFLALVYHDLVPVIVSYLGGDRRAIRWDFVWPPAGPAGTGRAACGACLLRGPAGSRLLAVVRCGGAQHCLAAASGTPPVILALPAWHGVPCRTAIVLGSLVPLTMFLSWEGVALSLLPAGLADPADSATLLQASLRLAAEGGPPGAALAVLDPAKAVAGSVQVMSSVPSVPAVASLGGTAAENVLDAAVVGVPRAVDPLQVFVRRAGPVVGSVVEGFSFLAVMTSFIGTTLSLSGENVRTRPPARVAKARHAFVEACVQPSSLLACPGGKAGEASKAWRQAQAACLQCWRSCGPAGRSCGAACQHACHFCTHCHAESPLRFATLRAALCAPCRDAAERGAPPAG